ncbi:hypothetical protein CBR_g9127 [Chara braunii]|uniref:Uncharacterized protein n=1 Tax=Chara braunii TaxID=69332 RepID=A0A388KNT0_CHABU|nr:hypothetical protein CBR_g9127 [Chara braunii]|eukprot:GBG71716.1 hypothetical protein CBR_g9127 [Chara braunii]
MSLVAFVMLTFTIMILGATPRLAHGRKHYGRREGVVTETYAAANASADSSNGSLAYAEGGMNMSMNATSQEKGGESGYVGISASQTVWDPSSAEAGASANEKKTRVYAGGSSADPEVKEGGDLLKVMKAVRARQMNNSTANSNGRLQIDGVGTAEEEGEEEEAEEEKEKKRMTKTTKKKKVRKEHFWTTANRAAGNRNATGRADVVGVQNHGVKIRQ